MVTVRLNNRGIIYAGISVSLIPLAVQLRSPPLILLSALSVAYLLAYPLSLYKLKSVSLRLETKLRHGVMYRGEVDVLQIKIINDSLDSFPLLKLSVRLPLSLYLVEHPEDYVFSLPYQETKVINIPILPTARGSYILGPVQLSLSDPFFLFEEIVGQIDEIPLKVYPKRIGSKVSKARSRELFNRLIGLFATRMRGVGTEFHGLREYIRGDPVKIVDWAATARANKLISREFEEEKKLEIIIALAAGTTTRGNKFDFMLGVAMDLYEGIVAENHPCGLVIFDEKILVDFEPSPSHRRKMKIWNTIFSITPNDVYADYSALSSYIDKRGITDNLVIILGDLEYDFNQTVDSIRQVRLRNNHVIFLDVWGYQFSYQEELRDAAADRASDNYGVILSNVIGRGLEQDSIFRGLEMKQEIARYRAIYGYLHSSTDNVIDSIERALFAFFGNKVKV